MYKIIWTTVFNKWYRRQEITVKVVVDARFKRVNDTGELGDVKHLGNKLFEFRWKIGIRVYFLIKGSEVIVLLNGGNKNDQKRNIKKARTLQKAYEI